MVFGATVDALAQLDPLGGFDDQRCSQSIPCSRTVNRPTGFSSFCCHVDFLLLLLLLFLFLLFLPPFFGRKAKPTYRVVAPSIGSFSLPYPSRPTAAAAAVYARRPTNPAAAAAAAAVFFSAGSGVPPSRLVAVLVREWRG